jgi:acetoin:2,6-dichlorophenolindophenol oxidoreductase subunit alpha
MTTDKISQSMQLNLYKSMVQIREFEEQVQRSFLEGLVQGTTHLCQGQEAVCAGACLALREDDYVTNTYRGHGHCLARGIDMEAAFAELFGRSTGLCAGLGGSMHFTDVRRGLLGAFGIVGAGLPVAVGAGLAAQLAGAGQVSVTFFGDGAVNIGAFHEAMNIAQVWRLPVLFICENNLYGEYTRINFTTPFEDLVKRADGYAMAANMVDGNDVEAVFNAVSTAAAAARSGSGPTFIECKTYRQRGHSRTDPGKYRDPAEVEAWLARDPITLYREKLNSSGALSGVQADDIVAEWRRQILAAAKGAAAAAFPDPNQDFASRLFAKR